MYSKSPFGVTHFIGMILLASTLYAGSYLSLLEPEKWAACALPGTIYVRTVKYRIDNNVTETIFKPALWLDQQLRPGYWNWFEGLDLIILPDDTLLWETVHEGEAFGSEDERNEEP